MTRQTTRALTIAAAVAALLLVLPGRASAQRVRIDVKVSDDLSREIRDAMRDVSTSVGDALREVSRELGRDLPRSIGRDLAVSLRDLPKIGRLNAWDGRWSDAQDRNFRGRAEDRQTRSLAIGANGTIELDNLSGDITVTAGSGRDASIELIRRSRGRTDADARTGLERVKVNTQMVGTRAVVKTDYPNERQPAYSVSVDMIVTAPPGTRVVVQSVSANVKVTGIRGELSINTISGDLTLNSVGAVAEAKSVSGDIHITDASSDSTLDTGTVSGDVTLQQVKARRINAGTVSGSVSARDITCDTIAIDAMSGDAWFSGELARNGRYEITSHSGDVHFTPSGGVGFTLTASSFGGDVSSSIAIRTSGTRSRRTTLNGTVGDGSATVTLKTFSGDITVGGKGQ